MCEHEQIKLYYGGYITKIDLGKSIFVIIHFSWWVDIVFNLYYTYFGKSKSKFRMRIIPLCHANATFAHCGTNHDAHPKEPKTIVTLYLVLCPNLETCQCQ